MNDRLSLMRQHVKKEGKKERKKERKKVKEKKRKKVQRGGRNERKKYLFRYNLSRVGHLPKYPTFLALLISRTDFWSGLDSKIH